MMPNKDQLIHLAGQLEAQARFLREHGPNALRIAQDLAAPLKSSDDTGRRPKGDHSDPTGSSATARVEPEQGWAREVADAWPPALKACEESVVRVNDLMVPLSDCLRKGKPQRRQDIPACANIHGCPDDAKAVKAGRCDTCYQYRARNERDRDGRRNKGSAA